MPSSIRQTEEDLAVNAQILESLRHTFALEKMQKLWENAYISKKDQNPANDIRGLASTIKADELIHKPQLIKFAREYYALTEKRISVKQAQRDPELYNIKESSKLAHDYLDKLYTKSLASLNHNIDHSFNNAVGSNITDIDLPEDHKKYLSLYEQRLALDSANPLKPAWHFVSAGMHHAKEEVKERPFACAVFGAVGMQQLGYINGRLGKTVNFDPTLTIAETSTEEVFDGEEQTGLDFLSGMNTSITQEEIAESDLRSKINSIDLNTQHGCSDTSTHFSGNDLGLLGDLMGVGCFRNDTLKYEAEQTYVSAMELFYHDRYEFGLYESTQKLGDTVLPHGELFNAFSSGAGTMSSIWTDYDIVENFAVHPPMFFAAAISSFAMTAMTKNEWKELSSTVKDTMHRIETNNPYTKRFVGGAILTNLAVNQGLDPSIVYYGIGGAYAAEYTHRYLRYTKAGNFIEKTAGNLSDKLEPVLSTLSAQNGFALEKPTSTWKAITQSTKTRLTTAAIGGFLAADAYATGGQTTAAIAGGSIVTAKFWAGNALQEIGWHTVCLLGGGATGTVGGSLYRTVRYVEDKIKTYFGRKQEQTETSENDEPASRIVFPTSYGCTLSQEAQERFSKSLEKKSTANNKTNNTSGIKDERFTFPEEPSDVIFLSQSRTGLSRKLNEAIKPKTPCPYKDKKENHTSEYEYALK